MPGKIFRVFLSFPFFIGGSGGPACFFCFHATLTRRIQAKKAGRPAFTTNKKGKRQKNPLDLHARLIILSLIPFTRYQPSKSYILPNRWRFWKWPRISQSAWMPTYYLAITHQGPVVFGFLACPWSATSTEGSHWPQITWIWHLHALGRTSPWDPGPSDPRGVPRDQKFWRKNFLISSKKETKKLPSVRIWFPIRSRCSRLAQHFFQKKT